MLKVLMMGPDLSARGGITSVVRGYLDAGLADMCDLRYIPSMVDGPKFRKLLVAARAYAELSRGLKDADVVHLHLSKGASYTRKRLFALRARKAGVPYVIHLHTGEFDRLFEVAGEEKRAEVRDLFGGAAAVIALSEEWRDYLAANVCAAERIAVLHNAVDIPPEPSYPSNGSVLFLGRLDDRKSPDALIRAGAALLPRHPEMRLVFAGDGDVARYEALAAELGVAGSCEFLGWVSGDREALLSSCPVFCLPSRAEGMPMALLEAMAHGMAVVATPVGGVPQVVRDGENGLLVPVGDDAALAGALDGVLSDAELRLRLGRAARRTVEAGFGMEAHLRRLMEIYRKAVAARGGGRER